MSQAASIGVKGTVVRPDTTDGMVSVELNVEAGDTAVGTLTDMGFEPGAAVPPRLGVAAVLAADITATDTAIPVGDAADLQSFGTVQIGDELIAYGRKDGNTLVAGGCSGGDSGTACIDSTECEGGGTCEPSGRGQADTTPAAHSMNDAVETPSTPDCTMSAALGAAGLNKDAVFSYLPPNCTPGTDCDTVRGIVIALDNLNPFPVGLTTLYNCRIAAGSEERAFLLDCADGQVSDSPDGEGLITDGPCTDGEVTVSSVVAACVGDCNLNGEVSLLEVQQAFNAFLDDPNECLAADSNADGEVTLLDVQNTFNNFLDGCE
jgi:hypothetical protein